MNSFTCSPSNINNIACGPGLCPIGHAIAVGQGDGLRGEGKTLLGDLQRDGTPCDFVVGDSVSGCDRGADGPVGGLHGVVLDIGRSGLDLTGGEGVPCNETGHIASGDGVLEEPSRVHVIGIDGECEGLGRDAECG